MGTIDIIILLVVFLSVAFAIYRGLANELLSISGWILAAFGALYSYLPAQNMLSPRLIQDPYVAGIIGSAVIALLILVIMTLLGAKISHHLRSSPLSGLDRFLGFLFGIFRAFLLMGSVYLIGNALVFAPEQTKQWHRENGLLQYVETSSNLLEKLIPQSIQNDMTNSGLSKQGTPSQQNEKKSINKGNDPQKNDKKTTAGKSYPSKTRDELDSLIQSIEGS